MTPNKPAVHRREDRGTMRARVRLGGQTSRPGGRPAREGLGVGTREFRGSAAAARERSWCDPRSAVRGYLPDTPPSIPFGPVRDRCRVRAAVRIRIRLMPLRVWLVSVFWWWELRRLPQSIPVGLPQCESRVPHKSRGARLVSCTRLICHENKGAHCNNGQLFFHDDLLLPSKPHAGSGAAWALTEPED